MICLSPVLSSCNQIADCWVPAVVMNDLPSGIMASPSSSLAPDGVSCWGDAVGETLPPDMKTEHSAYPL